MLVFFEQRLVVLSVPKTGTTALEAALAPLATIALRQPPQLKHTTLHRYHRYLGPYLEAAADSRFTVVAVMREPRDWLGSWYRYRARPGVEPAKSTADLSFDDFVRGWCSDPRPTWAEVGSQARFLQPKADRGVDRVFCYERLGECVRYLEQRLGTNITLPRVNVSPPGDLTLSDETAALLAKAAARDYALYAQVSAVGR